MTFSRSASLFSATAVALDTEPVNITALFSLMKREATCTAVLGFASSSATPNFTSLPRTPFVVCGEIFLISGSPLFRCSMARV